MRAPAVISNPALRRRVMEARRPLDKIRATVPIEREMQRHLRRAFQVQGELVQRRLSRHRARFPQESLRVVESVPAGQWASDWDSISSVTVQMFEQPITAGHQAGIAAGGAAAAQDLGLNASLNLQNPRAVEYIDNQGAARVTGINDTTRKETQAVLRKATDQGWSYDRTAAELQRKFSGYSRSRAHLIAVTETAEAYVHANRLIGDELQGAGVNMMKRWLDVGDDRVCEICEAAGSDDWIPHGDDFSTGDDAPPGHPGCRCDLLLEPTEARQLAGMQSGPDWFLQIEQ